MRPIFIFTIILFLFTACAAQPAAPTTGVTTTIAPISTLVPTEAPTPSPESLLPQEVKEKFELAGVDLTKMENAQYDKDGLHITLPGGEVIILTNTDLQKGIYNGQDNVLQYRDETNQNAIYTFDEATGKWGVERPIKEFPWCRDMHLFEQCVIDVADLQEHGRFAQSTLTEDLFDPTQLKIITAFTSLSSSDGKFLVPNVETAPNYKNEKTAPFKKIICLVYLLSTV